MMPYQQALDLANTAVAEKYLALVEQYTAAVAREHDPIKGYQLACTLEKVSATYSNWLVTMRILASPTTK